MLACLMLSPCAAGFAACENGSGNSTESGNAGGAQHEHTWSENYSYNDSKHYKICSGCNEKSEEGEHTYGTDGYTCTVCGYENEARKPAQKQNAADYFGGMKVSYAREKITDADGSAKSFNEILDRQIDLLAQDILYRLNYVYGGDGTSNYTRPTDNYDLNYNFGDKKALIKPATILAEINAEHTHTLTNLKADCIDCYQLSITEKDTDNFFDSEVFLKISGATSGFYTTLQLFRLKNEVTENSWSYTKKYSNIQSDNAKNSFKYAIAQILAGEPFSANYSAENYQSVLQKINSTGFADDCKNKFV